MKKILWLILVLILPCVSALNLNDTVLYSSGLDLTINITDLNASEVIVASDSIYFSKVNHSNQLQVNNVEWLSYNITDVNKSYVSTSLPYISLSNTGAKKVISNIDGSVSGTMKVQVSDCYISHIEFNTLGTAYDKNYNSSEWSCGNGWVEFNYTGMQKGTTNIYFLTNTVATNCTEGNVTLWFSIYDEDSPATHLLADAEVELNYWMPFTSFYVQNFTLDYAGNDTYGICLSNNITTLQADLYIKYTTENGFTHRYILANHTLNVADVETINIYNFNTTTDISDLKITTRYNSNYNYYPNVIAKLQRRYTAEGVWRTVQMDKSGDFGLVFFNIREQNIDYRLIFTDMNNHILRTTESVKFVCTSAICDLTLLLTPWSDAVTSAGLTAVYTYNNDTGMVNVDWEDSEAGTNTVTFTARQSTVTGEQYLCSETQVGSAGTMSCDLSGRSGVVELNIKGNGIILANELLDIRGIKLGSLIGNSEGALWSVLLMITCIMFGLFSPIGAVIAMLVSLITIYLLGIFTPITITFVIITTVVGIVIGFKVRS